MLFESSLCYKNSDFTQLFEYAIHVEAILKLKKIVTRFMSQDSTSANSIMCRIPFPISNTATAHYQNVIRL